jgi:uncharacterized protein
MELVNIIKPTHICNLACTYCYNDDVRDPVMKPKTLERIVQQSFDYARRKEIFDSVEFIWHGGEPMVPGLKFYESVAELQQKYSDGIEYSNIMQTNGVLINSKWIEFFKKHNYSVSISIDGPKHMHDTYRIDGRGRGSFDRVFKAIELVQASGLNNGCALVVSKATKDHVEEIFKFMAERKLPFNVIPMNKSGSARENYSDLRLDSEEYAPTWIKMYDMWFNASGEDYIYVSDFIRKTKAILTGRARDCVALSQCGNMNFSTDPVGDIYPCASLSGHNDLIFGNILTNDLVDILNSDRATKYRTREVDPHCASCKWQHICHGGCPARSYKFFDGDYNRRDYYCPSLYAMYEHVEQRIKSKGLAAGTPFESHMDDGLAGT